MPGPAPKVSARRRNLRPDWRALPPDGWAGPVPKWPMESQSSAERDLWRDLWRTPQAAAWHDLGWTRVVARYACLVAQSEIDNPDRSQTAEVALLGELRQIEDRLGLSPMAMRRLQWEVSAAATVTVVDDNVIDLFG
jgi:hypothetical protein